MVDGVAWPDVFNVEFGPSDEPRPLHTLTVGATKGTVEWTVELDWQGDLSFGARRFMAKLGPWTPDRRRIRSNARRHATRLIREWHKAGHHVGNFSHAQVARMLGAR
jgi:hypothetical protein